jgi:hypothetical protein
LLTPHDNCATAKQTLPKVENSARTTFRLSPVSFLIPRYSLKERSISSNERDTPFDIVMKKSPEMLENTFTNTITLYTNISAQAQQ